MLDDPLLLCAVMLKLYSSPASRLLTMIDVVSILLTGMGMGSLVAEFNVSYVTDTLVRGSPPVWMYDQVTVMTPLDDIGALHINAGTSKN